MSLEFSLLMFLITGGLLPGLAYQDGLGPFLKRGKPAELPGLSRKHGAFRPNMGENPLPLNKTHAPQLREVPPMQGHKHHKESGRSIKSDPKPSHEHKSNPHQRKTEPSSKHKHHEPAQKSAKRAKPAPAGEPRSHSKRPLPNVGKKGCKKPVTVKHPAPVKEHQCRFRRV